MLLSETVGQKCYLLHWRAAHFKLAKEIMLLHSYKLCKSSTHF